MHGNLPYQWVTGILLYMQFSVIFSLGMWVIWADLIGPEREQRWTSDTMQSLYQICNVATYRNHAIHASMMVLGCECAESD